MVTLNACISIARCWAYLHTYIILICKKYISLLQKNRIIVILYYKIIYIHYYTFFYTFRCYLSTNISKGHSYLDTNFNRSLALNGLVKDLDRTSVNSCIFNNDVFDDCETDGLSSSSCTIFFYYTTIRKSSIYMVITKV